MKIYFIRLTQKAYNFQKYCYYARVKRYGALDFDFNFSFGWKNEAAKFWTLKVVVHRKYFPLEHQTNVGTSIFGTSTTYKELEQQHSTDLKSKGLSVPKFVWLSNGHYLTFAGYYFFL